MPGAADRARARSAVTRASLAVEPIRSAPALPGRVLLVEDDPGDVLLVREMLAESPGADCQVLTATSVAEARDILLAGQPDCVLVDLSLPDASGLVAVEAVLQVAPDIPIVVLSGLNDELTAVAALHRGAQDYLTKGRVDGELLWRAIRYAVERKAAELELRHQALHDSLTGLANRQRFLDHLAFALARLTRSGSGRVAVLFMDLDGFKWVNDSLGHAAGDQLVLAVAERVTTVVRPFDVVARFGGDEFLVLCEDLDDDLAAVAVSSRIQQAIAAPFTVGGTDLRATASIGVAVTDDPTRTPESLIRDADVAMYRAKLLGKARSELFDETMREEARHRLSLETELHHAIDAGEFVLHYQPFVSLDDGQVWGAEALIRWLTDGRLVLPGEFIALAEDTGMILPIGAWVLASACTQLANWQRCAADEGRDPPSLSVNISPRQLLDPRFRAGVEATIASTGVDPSGLCLEVTETSLLKDERASLSRLEALKALGVRLCIDDFGTGYSALTYLRRFPFDTLKIDQSFVADVVADPDARAIVRSVINLADELGMTVIAEGVESALQVGVLRALGCWFVQGLHYGRPALPGRAGPLLQPAPPPVLAAVTEPD